MTTRRTSDPHFTFAAWLADGAEGEPPRDAALHASVCPECLRQVAAFDALARVDPSRAVLPASRRAAAPSRTLPSLRWSGAVAGTVLAVAVAGIGGSQLLASATALGSASPSPVGEVLGARGTPAFALTPSPSSDRSATAGPSASEGATPTPRPTVRPAAPDPTSALTTAAPRTPRPQPRTPAPTPSPRPSTTTSAAATPAATPTDSPVASLTAAPTPTQTAAQTPSPTNAPTATATSGTTRSPAPTKSSD
jgi:hypothetical protein